MSPHNPNKIFYLSDQASGYWCTVPDEKITPELTSQRYNPSEIVYPTNHNETDYHAHDHCMNDFDPADRLDPEAMDLHRSQIGRYNPPDRSKARPGRQNWPIPTDVINNSHQAPPGWNDNEPDLDPE